MNQPLKRKLSALDYPDIDNYKINDDKDLRKILTWAEENVIRKYDQRSRKDIKNINSSEWNKNFIEYKNALNCPNRNTLLEEIDWILSYALSLAYKANVKIYEKHCTEISKVSNTPNVIAENPLDRLDLTSDDAKKGVEAIRTLLHISPHQDHLVVLKAISELVCKRFNQNFLNSPESYVIKGTPYPFEDVDFDVGTKNAAQARAIKIMRLIYIQDLRNLQTKINELIVAVQSITANPKTDTKLGKVGV